MRERVDLARLPVVFDFGKARQIVPAVNVHCARTADALAARAPESQGRILLVLDLKKRVEHHRTRLFQVKLKLAHLELAALIRVPPVNLDVFVLIARAPRDADVRAALADRVWDRTARETPKQGGAASAPKLVRDRECGPGATRRMAAKFRLVV